LPGASPLIPPSCRWQQQPNNVKFGLSKFFASFARRQRPSSLCFRPAETCRLKRILELPFSRSTLLLSQETDLLLPLEVLFIIDLLG
jgi:hypothetical protein